MKTLLVLRHAKSDWRNPRLADHDRPLNKRGKREAARLGRRLREQGLLPDLILVSTAKRTRKTVAGLVAGGAYAGKHKARRAFYLAGPKAYLKVLRGVPDKYRRVMVVGHNPGLEQLVAQLTGKGTTLPTAALARLSLPITRWRKLGKATKGKLGKALAAR
jgi:phosphohistidine phosphatase